MNAHLDDTEAGPKTVPWPVDFGPKEPEPEGDPATEGGAVAVLFAVGAVLCCVVAAHLLARWL